jgi:hypothetical protein
MATVTWTSYGFAGDPDSWSNGGGWSGGTVPVSGDTVLITLKNTYNIALDANEGPYAALTISSPIVTLHLPLDGLTLSVSGLTTLSAGYISIPGNSALDTGSFSQTGGWLGMSNGMVAVTGQATLSGGSEGIYGGAFKSGSLTVSGGNIGMSGGAMTIAGLASVSGGSVAIYGGTFNAGSLAVSSGNIGISGGTVTASGALTLSGTGSIGIYNNAATLQAASLAAAGGTLGMSGGTLTVTGQASFTGGSDTFYGGSTFNAGSLQVGANGGAAQTITVNGGAVSVSGLTTIASASTAGGSTLFLYGGSLNAAGGINDLGTLSGAGMVSGGTISGNGTIYAKQGTLDISSTIASGPTFQIASGGNLKIDGTAIAAHRLNLIDVNQKLEIGPQGSLTINEPESDTSGTVLLDGGTLTDSQGFYGGAYQDLITGFGTINGTEYGLGYGRGATITASGGTLTINGDIYEGNLPNIASGATLSMLGSTQLSPTQAGAVPFKFLSPSSGTLRLATTAARQSFEVNGTLGNMAVSTSPTIPTDILDLADVLPSSITSASIANGNTIELFNGATMIDHFSLASSVGAAAVHWGTDGGGGSNIFLSTT